MISSKAVAVALLFFGQLLQAQTAIRLRSRTIVPPYGAAARRPTVRTAGPARRAHYILQFNTYPGPDIRNDLAARGIRVLAFVPDTALMVSSDPSADLTGLDATWTGSLEAADKLAGSLSEAAPAYLVFFYPDVDMSAARLMLSGQGFNILENASLLPYQTLVTGSARRLEALAARDEVSYIIPASAELAAGQPLAACPGALTEAGLVAEYATVGRGWSKDSSGFAALNYYFQSLTMKLDANSTRSEIERALREWARYAKVSFTEGGGPSAARTIAIQFANGAHGDGYAFDGAGGVLAHTFYPAPPNTEPIAGDLHFDAAEAWRIGADTDLFTVALHEIGHALGLGHSSKPGAVMYPYYRFSAGLTADDISGIQLLYGANTGATPDPPSTPSTPTTPTAPTTPATPTTPTTPAPSSDATPPDIRIVSPGYTIVSTSSASLSVSGTASDNVKVASVKWSTSTGDAGDAAGTTSWSATVPLYQGKTVVTIRAYDAAGNSAWRSITVVRR